MSTDEQGDRPVLSVVIPAYNAEKTLGEQLDALAAQQVDIAWEVLVCDNGSTDGTASLVQERQRSWPRLRLVDASARSGPAAARNIGVAQARGSLIAFCDADDVASDGWLPMMLTALETADIVCGGWDGTLLNPSTKVAISWSPSSEYRKPFLPHLPAGAGNNMAIRAAVFREVGGFDEAMHTSEDIDLAWRVQLAGHTFAFVPRALMHVRRREGVRAIWKQATSYGMGNKWLMHKYGRVIDAYEARADASSTVPTSAGTAGAAGAPRAGHSVARLARKITRRRSRADLLDRMWLVGLWWGDRSNPLPESVAQLTPPATLPYN